MDESGMIGNQMGKHTRTDMVAVYGTPYAIPHRKSDLLFQSTFVENVHFYFDENSLHALELYFDTNWRQQNNPRAGWSTNPYTKVVRNWSNEHFLGR
jgi:hypothetical protein